MANGVLLRRRPLKTSCSFFSTEPKNSHRDCEIHLYVRKLRLFFLSSIPFRPCFISHQSNALPLRLLFKPSPKKQRIYWWKQSCVMWVIKLCTWQLQGMHIEASSVKVAFFGGTVTPYTETKCFESNEKERKVYGTQSLKRCSVKSSRFMLDRLVCRLAMHAGSCSVWNTASNPMARCHPINKVRSTILFRRSSRRLELEDTSLARLWSTSSQQL